MQLNFTSTQTGTIAQEVESSASDSSSDAAVSSVIPARWEAAVRKMISSVMAEPTEEIYQLAVNEVAFIKPLVDQLLVNFTDDKKALFVEDLMVSLTKAIMKRSRVPLRHRLANAAIKVIVDHMGKMPPKKVLSQDVMDNLKSFSEQLIGYCQKDKKCRRYL